MATPQHSDYERGDSSPAPPPPPPPPPPHEEAVPSSSSSKPPPQPSANSDRPRRVDYRELLALFHADDADPAESRAQWDHLYQIALAEAREEFRVQQLERRKNKKRGAAADDAGSVAPTPTRGSAAGSASRLPPTASSASSASSGASSADKRPRPPAPSDTDPNKAMRVNRTPLPVGNRPKGGASKLMQKLGSRGI